MARISPTVLLGKTIRTMARLRGGGSALPGLVVERMQPTFLRDSLDQLPRGIIIVTGTNGKTTTTKIIAELLQANGLKVLTNRSGSNFTRGIVATILELMDLSGKLDFDIAVLELDEAYAKRFVQKVRPHYVVTLNVMRDQLDRFGEVDATARLLRPVLEAASDGCIVNRDDPLLTRIAAELDSQQRPVHYFGVDESLRSLFPNDDEILAQPGGKQPKIHQIVGDVELASIDEHKVGFRFGKSTHWAELQLNGVYNFQNAAAALTTVQAVLPEVEPKKLLEQLAKIKPAFGRGETIIVNGQPVDLVLVKNPAGFRLSLQSFVKDGHQYMITINDQYADGRDVSWLWDVDFAALRPHGVAMVSGIRAYDMATRLQYDEVLFSKLQPNLDKALREFLLGGEATPKVIFCTYTAMLQLRKELKKYTSLERGL